jgi:proline-specific peptidase
MKMKEKSVRAFYLEGPKGRIFIKIVGHNERLSPLLVLHGGPGAPHDYLEPLMELADERQVIFYDQLGCGKSDRPSDFHDWDLDFFVEELAFIRKELAIDELHILGQSYGAMLAVSYALKKGQKGLKSFVLSGACLSSKRFIDDQRKHIENLPKDVKEAILISEENADYDSPAYQDAMMVFYRKHVCRMEEWPECLNRAMEKMGEDVYHRMWGPSEFTLTGNLKDVDLTDRLQEIDVPVLLTCGSFDEATPDTTAFYLEQFKNGRMVIFEDASHEHHLEEEASYLKIVATFLKDTD